MNALCYFDLYSKRKLIQSRGECFKKIKILILNYGILKKEKENVNDKKISVISLFNWLEASILKMTIELKSKQKLIDLPTLLFQKLKAIKLINLNLN